MKSSLSAAVAALLAITTAACHTTSPASDGGTAPDASSTLAAALREPDASGLGLSGLSGASAGGLLGHGLDYGPGPLVIPSGTASAMPAGASPPDREKELVDLVSGKVGPDALPVVPTDQGESFDEGLRTRLKSATRFQGGVTFSAVEVKGPLSQTAVARVLAGTRPRARQCFNHALASNPDLHGELHVKFEILANGEVKSATDVPPTPANKAAAGNVGTAPGLTPCVLGVVKRLSFDVVDAGTTTATFTAHFEAQADTAQR